MKYNSKNISSFPNKIGVYIMKNAFGKVIYIGKANNIRSRLRQYFISKTDDRPQIKYLQNEVARIDTIIVSNEKEALILENNLIKKYKPKYNILLKDDKTFIRLLITNHKWPMIRLIRAKKTDKKDGKYFGPYTSAQAAKNTLDLILKLFPLRQCSDTEFINRSRPCILYDIKKCIAPCTKKCTKAEYDLLTEGAIDILEGKNKKIINKLTEEMKIASKEMQYEKANNLLNLVNNLKHVTQKQIVETTADKNTDVFGYYQEKENIVISILFYREGKLLGSKHFHFSNIASSIEDVFSTFLIQYYSKEVIPYSIILPISLQMQEIIVSLISKKKKVSIMHAKKGKNKKLAELANNNAKSQFLKEKQMKSHAEKILLSLQELCNLTRFPRNIECFDISNIAGKFSVGSKISYIDGSYDKKRVKLFQIKSDAKGDCPALNEVLTRHLNKAKEENSFCDLIIVDGGRAQLNTALNILKKLDIANIDVISVSKEKALHTKGLTKEKIFIPFAKEAISLSEHSPILFFLQQIRDHAHRVAISFHRKKREKTTSISFLDDIPNIGEKKKKALLKYFKSPYQIKNASIDELKKIKELTSKDIENIKKHSSN